MYKVFFKESCFLLTDNQNLLKEGDIHWVHRDFMTTKNFIYQTLEKGIPFKAVLYDEDPEDLFTIFKSCFTYVKAGGGAVIQNSDILVIKRLGMIDLPKGHLEYGETMEQCAVREVEEECGLKQVSILSPLDTTLHIYYRNESWFLKKTYWYRMSAPSGQSFIPQTEEDIEEVLWYPIHNLSQLSNQTYPSLREVFHKLQTEA